MARQISGSVGLSAKNKPDDVQSVQELLNFVPGGLGGPKYPVTVDGVIGPETAGAITRFQNKNFGWADGRVDPGGKTLAKLNAYADMEGDPGPAPQAPSVANPKPGSSPKKPGTTSSGSSSPQIDGGGSGKFYYPGALITSVKGTVRWSPPGQVSVIAYGGIFIPPYGKLFTGGGKFDAYVDDKLHGDGWATLRYYDGETVSVGPGSVVAIWERL